MKTMFYNICSDFCIHGRDWEPKDSWAMMVYCFGRWRYGVRPSVLRVVFSLLYRAFTFIQIIAGVELPGEAIVEHNLLVDLFGGIIFSRCATPVSIPAEIDAAR
jgi:serine O-acetyltransferase